MRTLGTHLSEVIAGEAMHLAQLITITRRDTQIYRFTSCNRSVVDKLGNLFSPLNSVAASAQVNKVGTGVDNLEVVGILSSDAIAEEDLLLGKFDGAAITVKLVDPADTSDEMIQFRGLLGAVSIVNGTYTIELRSLTQRLAEQVGEVTSATCRVHKLGDARCGVDLGDYTDSAASSPGASRSDLLIDISTRANGFYDCGLITWTAGANAGIVREIKSSAVEGSNTRIRLQEPIPFAIEAGDSVTLTAGCDRTLATCKDKFSNVINFRGEPYIPGNDRMMQRGRGGS